MWRLPTRVGGKFSWSDIGNNAKYIIGQLALCFSTGGPYTGGMIQTTCLVELNMDCDEAINWVEHRIEDAGLQATRSFDFQNARSAHTHCDCPHHGTEQCDCQLIVLLVYDTDDDLVTLVVHGRDGRTQIKMVGMPELQPGKDLDGQITHTP